MWEYLVLDVAAQGVETPRVENDLLNERGVEGWELVSAILTGSFTVFYLKRPLPAPPVVSLGVTTARFTTSSPTA